MFYLSCFGEEQSDEQGKDEKESYNCGQYHDQAVCSICKQNSIVLDHICKIIKQDN